MNSITDFKASHIIEIITGGVTLSSLPQFNKVSFKSKVHPGDEPFLFKIKNDGWTGGRKRKFGNS